MAAGDPWCLQHPRLPRGNPPGCALRDLEVQLQPLMERPNLTGHGVTAVSKSLG